MFVRKLRIERVNASGEAHPCPIHWIDNFAMRNFTNDAVFDDALPMACWKRAIACLWTGCGPRWRTGSGARAI
ncbi:MAG: hypothetical protein ACYCSN_02565 [Acidobacteriaceae bacterium]